jgi:hypothetical protein
MTATLKALRALIEEQRDADASPSLARVMAELQAINGRKLTKREHAAIRDAAAVALRIGPDGTGWTIQTADHGTSIHGWRIRLSWQTTVCPVVDVDAIRRENPSYFSGAQDRNAIRAGWRWTIPAVWTRWRPRLKLTARRPRRCPRWLNIQILTVG